MGYEKPVQKMRSSLGAGVHVWGGTRAPRAQKPPRSSSGSSPNEPAVPGKRGLERTPPSPNARSWERGPQGGRARHGQGRDRCGAAASSPTRRSPVAGSPALPAAALRLGSSCGRERLSALREVRCSGPCSLEAAAQGRGSSLEPLPTTLVLRRDGVCKGHFWFLPFLLYVFSPLGSNNFPVSRVCFV